MRILFIIDTLKTGGKERRFIELFKGLSKNESLEIHLVMLSTIIDYKDVFDLPIKIHFFERRRKKDLSIFSRLYKLCKQIKPSIIQSCESMCSVYSLPVAKLLGIKFVNAMIYNAPFRLKVTNWIRSKLTFPMSDLIIANSEMGLKSYNAPKAKSVFIHNGYDLNRLNYSISTNEIQDELNLHGKKIVAMVGAFEIRKDYHTFLDAAIHISNTRKDIAFVAIGDGILLSKFQAMIPDSLKENIQLIGRKSNIERYLSAIDLGVLTTNHRIHGEGIPNAVLEFMAFGKPVIATNGGGTPELVKDGITGILIEPYDIQGLIKSILTILDDNHLAKRMGSEGKKIVIENFNLDKMVRSYEIEYNKLLQN